MKATLELHVTCQAGWEVECARFLANELRPEHFAVLAAIAAEVVAEHERRLGSTAVLVVSGPEAVDRVLADLRKAQGS